VLGRVRPGTTCCYRSTACFPTYPSTLPSLFLTPPPPLTPLHLSHSPLPPPRSLPPCIPSYPTYPHPPLPPISPPTPSIPHCLSPLHLLPVRQILKTRTAAPRWFPDETCCDKLKKNPQLLPRPGSSATGAAPWAGKVGLAAEALHDMLPFPSAGFPVDSSRTRSR